MSERVCLDALFPTNRGTLVKGYLRKEDRLDSRPWQSTIDLEVHPHLEKAVVHLEMPEDSQVRVEEYSPHETPALICTDVWALVVQGKDHTK